MQTETHAAMILGDRALPFSPEAELAVLGGMLIDREAIVTAAEMLDPGMFYREAHRRLFRAMLQVHEAGQVLDVITVVERLKESNEIEAVGGWDYVSGLVDAVPTAANLAYHATIVRDKAKLRRLIEVSMQNIRDVYDQGARTTTDIVGDAEGRILALGEASASRVVRAKERLWPMFELIERRQEQRHKLPGIPTGMIDVDRKLLGLQRGALTVVAGRPSMGKTALALGWALHASIGEGIPTLIESFEMSTDELLARSLAVEGNVDLQALFGARQLSQEEHQRIAAAAGHLNTAPLFIDDSADSSLSSVVARIRRARKAEGIELVVIDYLQQMDAADDERRQQIDAITRKLKRTARELNVAIVLLSQLSRAPEGRADKRPQLSDLRESGGIEQDADVVVMVYRPEYYMSQEKQQQLNGKEGLTEILVVKHRNGPTGSIQAWFRKASTRFESAARSPQGALL